MNQFGLAGDDATAQDGYRSVASSFMHNRFEGVEMAAKASSHDHIVPPRSETPNVVIGIFEKVAFNMEPGSTQAGGHVSRSGRENRGLGDGDEDFHFSSAVWTIIRSRLAFQVLLSLR